MPRAAWHCDAAGRYWIDVIVGGQPLPIMIDLGLVDPRNRVGFGLGPTVYDAMRESGQLSRSEFGFAATLTGSRVKPKVG